MDEIVKDFLIESNENLDRLDQELVKLETSPSSKELLASIFRTIHTIKGSCGFLGFSRLEKVAHAGENLLSKLRDGELALNAEITNALLGMVDAVRHMLSEIGATGHDGDNNYPELLEELKLLQSGRYEAPPPQNDPAAAEMQTPQSPRIVPVADEPPTQEAPPPPAIMYAEQPAYSPKAPPEPQKQTETQAAPQPASDARAMAAETETVRVGVTLLDRLMNLVGELVLARNQLVQFAGSTQDAGLIAISQRMSLIATELQEQTMKTRMQPIGNIWNKFPRTVRDLALGCHKEVRLEMEGQDTELDRTIIEAIKDPLTHLVRNSVDHGIEPPQVRLNNGKDSTGILLLRAYHEGGQVNIEITDDGGGLNKDRICNKAIERGLITPQQAARMPDRDIFNLIFMPGFSTAEKITNVSGRGVGMDVVKTNVEKIGGMVDVQSVPGKGTTVRVKIPLTLAIIPALLVTCKGERFAIPQVSLTELVRLEGEQKIEMVHGAPVYRLRGQLLPLVYLNRQLNLQAPFNPAEKSGEPSTGKKKSSDEVTNIVVLQAEDQRFGLVVDEVIDTEEIVVKPLGKQLKELSIYSGATIMGDGRVALILDVLDLAQQAKVLVEDREAALSEKEKAGRKQDLPSDREALLLVQNGQQGRVAIPLSVVARLEEFAASNIERTGNREVVQYRGRIMPLIRLAEVVPAAGGMAGDGESTQLQVVVYSASGHSVGVVVDRIVDIVDEKFTAQESLQRSGVLGSSVIQQKVTDLIDVPALVRDAFPELADLVQSGDTAAMEANV